MHHSAQAIVAPLWVVRIVVLCVTLLAGIVFGITSVASHHGVHNSLAPATRIFTAANYPSNWFQTSLPGTKFATSVSVWTLFCN